MKKGVVVALFALLLSINFVSAYYFPGVRGVSQDLVYTVTDILEPILYALFGGFATVYLFETLLLFLIILCLVYLILGKIELFQEQKVVRGILTVVIPLLSVRFFDYEWLITVFDTYKLLGIVLASIVPFLLYFYFLYNIAGDHGILRKLGWALFIAVYIGLWSGAHVSEFNSLVYFWTFIAGAVCLLGDNTINRRLRLSKLIKDDERFKDREVGRLRMEIQDLNTQLHAGAISPSFARKAIRDLEKHIHEIRRL